MTDEQHVSPTPTNPADKPADKPDKGKAEKPAKPVRHVDPIQLATTLRDHLSKHESRRRTDITGRVEATLLDADARALMLAITKLPGVVDAADLRAALALALHGI